jgi:transposase
LVLSALRRLLPAGAQNNEQFVLIDSTHIMSESENLAINRPGYNGSFDFGKQLRLMYIFSTHLKKPVYYRLIQGNIPDISAMRLCVKEMGVENVIYIADKGFYSRTNIALLDEQRLQYIIPLRRSNGALEYTPLEQPNFKKLHNYFMYQGRIIWYYPCQKDGLNLVTFLDERLRVEEERDYLERILTHPESHSRPAYEQNLPGFGTLTLLGKTISSRDPWQLYEIYKRRNEIEIMFDSYKTFLQADTLYMQNRHVLVRMAFCELSGNAGLLQIV